MSRTVSPGSGKRYPLLLVCAVFRIARASVYAHVAAGPSEARAVRDQQSLTRNSWPASVPCLPRALVTGKGIARSGHACAMASARLS